MILSKDMKFHQHKHEESIASLSGLLDAHDNRDAFLIRRVVITGCLINAMLMAMKLIAGYYGQSDALVADGFHSLNDVAADIVMLLFVGISFRPADERFSYGYGKFQTFSSFLISVALLFVAVEISLEAIESIIDYSHGTVLPQPSVWTIVVVVISMIGKEFLFRYYRSASRKTDTMALLTSAWHHRSDAMASIATLIGVTFAHFFGKSWRILDPCASLVLVVFIVVPAIRMLVPAFMELMDRSLSPEIISKGKETVVSTPDVETVEYITGRKNGHYYIFNIGASVNRDLTVNEGYVISSQIEKRLHDVFGKNIMTSITILPSNT